MNVFGCDVCSVKERSNCDPVFKQLKVLTFTGDRLAALNFLERKTVSGRGQSRLRPVWINELISSSSLVSNFQSDGR
jgi:hypothetical protein